MNEERRGGARSVEPVSGCTAARIASSAAFKRSGARWTFGAASWFAKDGVVRRFARSLCARLSRGASMNRQAAKREPQTVASAKERSLYASHSRVFPQIWAFTRTCRAFFDDGALAYARLKSGGDENG
jgi:hypothetical protein